MSPNFLVAWTSEPILQWYTYKTIATPISEWGSRGDFLRAICVPEMASEESREKLRRGQDAGLGWARRLGRIVFHSCRHLYFFLKKTPSLFRCRCVIHAPQLLINYRAKSFGKPKYYASSPNLIQESHQLRFHPVSSTPVNLLFASF